MDGWNIRGRSQTEGWKHCRWCHQVLRSYPGNVGTLESSTWAETWNRDFFVFPYLWTSTCATNSPSLSRSLFQDECNHIRVFNLRGTAQRAVEKTCTHRKAGLTLSVYPFCFDILVCFPFFSEKSKFKHKFIIESFDFLESFVKFVFDSLVGTYWYQIHPNPLIYWGCSSALGCQPDTWNPSIRSLELKTWLLQ